MLNNYAIRTKLLLCFGALFALMLVVGGIAFYQMSSATSTVDELGVQRRAKLEAAAAINQALAEYRMDSSRHVLTSDPAKMRVIEGQIQKHARMVDEKIAWLDPRVTVPVVRAELEKLKQNWPAFRSASMNFIAASRANRMEEAAAELLSSTAKYERASENAATIQRLQSGVMNTRADEAASELLTGEIIIGVTVVLTAGLIVVMLMLLNRLIAAPISRTVDVVTAIARGNRDVHIENDGRHDEIGKLATAVADLRNQLSAADQATAEQGQMIVTSIGQALQKLADGDLTARVHADLTGMFATLKTDFNSALDALSDTMRAVADASSRINNGAGEIRAASDDLASRTAQQAASLEETAAAMSQINQSIQRASSGAGQALSVVKDARGDADVSGQVVTRTVQAMGNIERTSNEISDIIGLIDGIAFQTNLLALNAGVEAARAGEAGRGFAVVASEVRALAQRSADAATEVKSRINSSREQVQSGVALVNETGESLKRIIERISGINELVAEIATTAENQASAVSQVNAAIAGMEQVTQQNAAMVEESTAAARNLAEEAVGMAETVNRFNLGHHSPASGRATTPSRSYAPAPVRHRAVPAVQGNLAVAAEDDWTEF